MNKVIISSLLEVSEKKNLDYIKRNNINLISIRDSTPSKQYQNMYDIIDSAGINNLLVVNFDDILYHFEGIDERPPEEKDIVRILEWAKKKMKENKNDFIIHCTAGISRSSAVAILVKYLIDPDRALKVINPLLHSPNIRILEIGEKVLNAKGIKDDTVKILKENDAAFIENLGTNGSQSDNKIKEKL